MPLVAIRLMGRVRMLVRLEKQRVQAQGLTEEWLKRAKLALEKGDEEAARAALERKNQQEEQANSLGAQLESQEQAVQNLFAQMQQLEQKISEAKMKKDQLKARAQTAKVSTKINDMMSKSSSTGALEAFNRMSDKVEQMEAEAEVARELSGSDTSLDKRFAALESSSKVAPPPPRSLPADGGRTGCRVLATQSAGACARTVRMCRGGGTESGARGSGGRRPRSAQGPRGRQLRAQVAHQRGRRRRRR